MASRPFTPRDVLNSPDFGFFLTGRFIWTIALQAQAVAIGWQIYEMTGRALDLGLVGLAQFLPQMGFSVISGPAADRFDRRTIMVVSQFVMALCALGLFYLSDRGVESVWPIYAILVIVGTARAFIGPAAQALAPHLVPEEQFSSAVAWSSSSWQLALIIGPAGGGVLYAWAGDAATVYAVVMGLYVLAFLSVLAIRTRTGGLEEAPMSWKTLSAGVRYVWAQKLILGSISLDLFAVLLGGAVALLPIVAKDILGVGPSEFGLLRAAPGVGAAVMALFLAHYPIRKRAGVTMFAAVMVFGIMTILFGLSRSFWLSLTCLALLGAADMFSVVIRHTLVQLRTPPEMRGRVSAVNVVFIGASNELGEFESGVTAAWFGTVPAILIGGIGTCLVVLIWAKIFPDLRKLDRL